MNEPAPELMDEGEADIPVLPWAARLALLGAIAIGLGFWWAVWQLAKWLFG